MRIVGGSARGRRLAALGKGDAAAALRPTTDRLREALFNILAGGRFGDPVSGAQVLDLFAGTGALGFEALSRGAAGLVAVENGRKAQGLWRENARLCGFDDRAHLVARDAARLGPASGAPCSLVFLDPPYGRDLGARAVSAALSGGWIAPDALIVWEESAAMQAPPGTELVDQRSYGATTFTFLRVSSAPTTP